MTIQIDKKELGVGKDQPKEFDSEYYGMNGTRYKDDNDDVFAKKVWNGRYFHYYIRYATSGPESPHLMNPYGIHFAEGDHKQVKSHTGKRKYEYKKVNESAFNLYKLFLETSKQMYYRQADRALE